MNSNRDFFLYAFPTSFSKELNIRVLGTKRAIPFSIFTSSGECIYHDFVSEITTIDTFLFPPGIYFLRYRQEGKNRFIKLHKPLETTQIL
jgi:hypothetical protein